MPLDRHQRDFANPDTNTVHLFQGNRLSGRRDRVAATLRHAGNVEATVLVGDRVQPAILPLGHLAEERIQPWSHANVGARCRRTIGTKHDAAQPTTRRNPYFDALAYLAIGQPRIRRRAHKPTIANAIEKQATGRQTQKLKGAVGVADGLAQLSPRRPRIDEHALLEEAAEAIDQRRQRRLVLERDHGHTTHRPTGLGIQHDAAHAGRRPTVVDPFPQRWLGGTAAARRRRSQTTSGSIRIGARRHIAWASRQRDVAGTAKSEQCDQNGGENEHGKACRDSCSVLHGWEGVPARASGWSRKWPHQRAACQSF